MEVPPQVLYLFGLRAFAFIFSYSLKSFSGACGQTLNFIHFLDYSLNIYQVPPVSQTLSKILGLS